MNDKYSSEKGYIIDSLREVGLSNDQSEIVADVMVTADLYGVESHGAGILKSHLDRIRRGGYNLFPNFNIIRETTAFAVIEGNNAMGFVSAKYCMDYAVEKCHDSGIFAVFSPNNNTFGPAFYYPLKAAEQGFIGFISSNSPAQMAPVGGKEKMLGTNPFAAVIPVPGQSPIIIDMATSVVAKSKFKQYKEAGKKLPAGWALDKNGNPTNDPDEGIQGLVLPMAGFKGYGIAMLIDILAGVMSGAAYLNQVGRFYSGNNSAMNVGFFCIAIDPYTVLGSQYDQVINKYVDMLRGSECIDGQQISLPGDDRIRIKRENTACR